MINYIKKREIQQQVHVLTIEARKTTDFEFYKVRKLLIDGGHRLEVAKHKQHTKIFALVGSDEPDWTEYDEYYDEE